MPAHEQIGPAQSTRAWLRSLSTTQQAACFLTSPALSRSCSFGAEIFSDIMENLIRNPNITSSHLFRADIYYDSEKDASFSPEQWHAGPDPQVSTFVKHMRKDLHPWSIELRGFRLTRLLVRRLVPRNPGLDADLVQTCCFMRSRPAYLEETVCSSDRLGSTDSPSSIDDSIIPDQEPVSERNLVLYLPHIDEEEDMPWYHPKVRVLGFLHDTNTVISPNVEHQIKDETSNTISLHVIPFTPPETAPPPTDTRAEDRLHRTLQNLLQTITRHGAGQLAGYQKRAHHDRLIAQSSFQDTYTRLKQKYAKRLLHEFWQETTDATKGVFEDLGIAAFLIELWRDMFQADSETPHNTSEAHTNRENGTKRPFPGFVDIGCGNGVLVYILISEGYPGSGFDARKRKTWIAFPESIQDHLKRQVLIPSIFDPENGIIDEEEALKDTVPIHNGRFRKGTFIISNHADELSAWTPLLAYMSDCPFICIPCCSHDLTGSRFRAPASLVKDEELDFSKLDLKADSPNEAMNNDTSMNAKTKTQTNTNAKNAKLQQQPSAYATLTAYIAHLTRAVGFVPEKEVLRIPSTRNNCIVGRSKIQRQDYEEVEEAQEEKETLVCRLVERETRKSLSEVSALWRRKAGKISKPGNGLASKH